MIKIYHNPRCSKSRQGLQILTDSKLPFTIVDYLKKTPSVKEIETILIKLNLKPIDLVRKNEAIWKENFKGKDLDDAAIIKAMADFPKLIERPIVINNNKAVIGRPPELIKAIL